jgi:hypothetical protein
MSSDAEDMAVRTRVIVRLVPKKRMVTKDYRKGVYDRVRKRALDPGARLEGESGPALEPGIG